MPDEALPIRQFRLGEAGIARVLGPLEASILDALWELTAASPTDVATIGQVCAHLGATANYKTVQTVMNRLVEKGVLLRATTGRAHDYRPSQTRAELDVQVTRSVVAQLLAEYGDVAITQFVEAVRDASPAQLAVLRRLMTPEEDPT